MVGRDPVAQKGGAGTVRRPATSQKPSGGGTIQSGR